MQSALQWYSTMSALLKLEMHLTNQTPDSIYMYDHTSLASASQTLFATLFSD
jgi:hypothetical protein